MKSSLSIIKQKVELYITSLWLLFGLIIVNKISIPWCTTGNCHFITDWTLIKSITLKNIIPLISFGLMLLGLIFYWRFRYKVVSGGTKTPKTITAIENVNYENLTFLTTYIIPLLCFDLDFNLDENRNGLMMVLVLTIIGAIYIKTNWYYTNPTLSLLGYHIYKVDTIKNKGIIFISKDQLKVNDCVHHKLISDNVYFVRL